MKGIAIFLSFFPRFSFFSHFFWDSARCASAGKGNGHFFLISLCEGYSFSVDEGVGSRSGMIMDIEGLLGRSSSGCKAIFRPGGSSHGRAEETGCTRCA